MKDKIILLSKDILRADYLEPYGQKYWKTPNINELAAKGTVFKRHYTAAPSSAMSYTGMFSGLFSHEINRSNYTEVKPFEQVPTLFDILQNKGYDCHVIWDTRWYQNAYRFSRTYGDKRTNFHNIKIEQVVGPHKIDDGNIKPGDDVKSIEKVLKEIDDIKEDKVFIWIHLPHVLHGRTGYGSDIDLFDKLAGELRKRFSDDSIYITADHGHMNLKKGIPVYGHHVYEDAIHIPLITPKINDLDIIDFPTSNIQLKEIILEEKISKLDYVYADSKYYAQLDRRLAIIKDNYKYIYNKKEKTEELYDIDWDRSEDVNLLNKTITDPDRKMKYHTSEVFFYPYWDKISEIVTELRVQKSKIWKEPCLLIKTMINIKFFLRKIKRILRK